MSGAHPPRLDTLMDLADAAGGEFVIGPGRTIAFRAKRARAGARVKRRAPRSNYLPQAAEQVAAVARS